MRVKILSAILTLVTLFCVTRACRPLNDNQCKTHEECCSKNCWRGGDWATGVCKEGQGGGGGNPNPPPPSGGGAKESGICSWYGADGEIPHGWPTACGEPFDREDLTAAHRTLPCGTKIRVTNSANGRSVVVRVNDRGPHVDGRIVDLTRKAFVEIEPDLGKGLINCSYV